MQISRISRHRSVELAVCAVQAQHSWGWGQRDGDGSRKLWFKTVSDSLSRTERLFALTEVLRARRTGVIAEELAERFGVSLRTIYRDLAALRRAELPLEAERGRGGGYALARHYNLPPVNFTAREAAVLIAAGEFLGHMRVLPFSKTLRQATDKLRGALGSKRQRELQGQLERLQAVGVPCPESAPGVAEAIEAAFFDGSAITIVYGGRYGRSRRRIRVRALVLDRAETLINAWDEDRGQARQFQMQRIVAVEP